MGYYMAGGEAPPAADSVDLGDYDGFLRRRRMNAFNGRALNRAMRRTKGFMRMAKKAVAYAHRVKFQKRRRG